MLNSFSVIIPVLNKENEIVRTLESVDASIAYFFQHHDPSHPVVAEVVVVNEASSDRTLERVTEFSQGKPYIKVISHARRMSAGTARNTGVKVAQGEVLFFCDGDDLYFQEHIYLCFQLLNHDPQNPRRSSITVSTKKGEMTIDLPNQAVGVLRTGVYTQDTLHPYWKVAVENSVPQNLCVRRDCHEFIEGFPEEKIPYNQVTCEDISYQNWLSRFFKILKVNVETVEYIRYPGNMFDKQLQKFQTPPDQYQDDTPAEMRELHGIRQKIEQERLGYLFEKFIRIEKTPEFLSVVNWQQLGTEYLSRNQFNLAIQLFTYGIETEPDNLEVRNLLAAAYNNMGSALRSQGNVAQAAQAFQQALAARPALSATDSAKVHFNAATSLRDLGDYEQALAYLQTALELEPALAEGMAERSKLKYQVQLSKRGYQFSQDRFAPLVPIWEQYLHAFVNLPDLRMLELGSGEGCSTCWLLNNILTADTARITCVDGFEGNASTLFDQNIARTETPEKVRKVTGQAPVVLRSLIPNSFHLAYLSGSTVASDVLENLILTWRLVKPGGILILDHYGFHPLGSLEGSPRTAIDAFLTIFAPKINVLYQSTQVILEKTTD